MWVRERFGCGEFKVFDVKVMNLTTYILIFKDGDWEWADIDFYVPR